jgi:hypothetical protein
VAGGVAEKPSSIADEPVNCATTMEVSMEVPQKIKNKLIL